MEWLSVKEIAAQLGIHPNTVYARIKDGSLEAIKFGGLWRVAEPILEQRGSLIEVVGNLGKALNAVETPVAVYDSSGVLVTRNEAHEELYQLTAQEIRAKPIGHRAHPDDQRLAYAGVAKIVAAGHGSTHHQALEVESGRGLMPIYGSLTLAGDHIVSNVELFGEDAAELVKSFRKIRPR